MAPDRPASSSEAAFEPADLQNHNLTAASIVLCVEAAAP